MSAPSPLLAAAINEFRAVEANQRWDTDEDIGGCWTSSRDFARILHRRGIPYRFHRYRDLPDSRTEHQHVTVVEGLVVDWIARQHRPASTWPDVRPLEVFEAEFGAPLDGICFSCGHGPDWCSPCLGPEPDPKVRAQAEVDDLLDLLLGQE